jgi:tetratricopeptide (TPR) repeat protein
MLASFVPANVRRTASAFAMAIALAGGAVGVTASLPGAAHAEDYSEAFVAAYQAVQATTQNGATDFSPARPLIPALTATLASADEKQAAGNLILVVGQNLRDAALQRQGIELMLASGKVPPESQGQYYYYVGNFALQGQDYAAGREALRQALSRNYMPAQAATDPALDPRTQILQSYFLQEDFAGLKQYATELVGAAGTAAVPESWLTYGLQAAIESEDLASAMQFSVPLVTHYPTARNIRNSIRVATSLGNLDTGPVLADAQRLMFFANAMSDRSDYVAYVASIDSRLMANETLRVLEQGKTSGHLPESDNYYAAEFQVANERSAAERRDAAGMLTDARGAATGLEAYEAGEVYLSLGDYAQAETLYALALEKGSTDRNRDLTRLGIAQAMQGKKAEAQASFAQVEGNRASVAQLWAAYIASQG